MMDAVMSRALLLCPTLRARVSLREPVVRHGLASNTTLSHSIASLQMFCVRFAHSVATCDLSLDIPSSALLWHLYIVRNKRAFGLASLGDPIDLLFRVPWALASTILETHTKYRESGSLGTCQ